MISFNLEQYCTGCYACIDICPRNCIKPTIKSGFMIPQIIKTQCVNCGKCENICPVINNDIIIPQKYTQKLYAAYTTNKRVRNISSSGGIFYTLANHIILNNGNVYAASFDDLDCKHMLVSKKLDIFRCIGSKYTQSDMRLIYNKIKHDVKSKQLVLFIGAPCQCKALLNIFNGNKPNNLFIIDFICHGICSQELFNKSIKYFEKKKNCKVIDFTFRHKTINSIRSYKIEYKDIYNNYNQEINDPKHFPFYNAFLNHYIFRKSCYQCSFKRLNRNSDITLGDFWNIEKIDTEITDEKLGYSAVIINNENGDYLFELVKDKLKYKNFSLNTLITNNYALTNKDRIPTIRYLYRITYNNFAIMNDLLLTNNPSLLSRIIRAICNKLDNIKLKL